MLAKSCERIKGPKLLRVGPAYNYLPSIVTQCRRMLNRAGADVNVVIAEQEDMNLLSIKKCYL